MKRDKQKPVDELRMSAEEFDAIMRTALGVPTPANIVVVEPERKSQKTEASPKKP